MIVLDYFLCLNCCNVPDFDCISSLVLNMMSSVEVKGILLTSVVENKSLCLVPSHILILLKG